MSKEKGGNADTCDTREAPSETPMNTHVPHGSPWPKRPSGPAAVKRPSIAKLPQAVSEQPASVVGASYGFSLNGSTLGF